MVGAAGPADLDAYLLGIERLLFTRRHWPTLADADVDARSEQWDRMAERQSEDPAPDYDHSRPWSWVIRNSAY